MHTEMRYKKCTKCNVIKPFSSFGKDSSTKDKKAYHCLKCNAQARMLVKKSWGHHIKTDPISYHHVYDQKFKRSEMLKEMPEIFCDPTEKYCYEE